MIIDYTTHCFQYLLCLATVNITNFLLSSQHQFVTASGSWLERALSEKYLNNVFIWKYFLCNTVSSSSSEVNGCLPQMSGWCHTCSDISQFVTVYQHLMSKFGWTQISTCLPHWQVAQTSFKRTKKRKFSAMKEAQFRFACQASVTPSHCLSSLSLSSSFTLGEDSQA